MTIRRLEELREQATDILLWYGFLGVKIGVDKSRYIYSVNYDMKRLKGFMAKAGRKHLRYCINPAFWLIAGHGRLGEKECNAILSYG